ncbi:MULTISPECIES: tol-pal system protein YbgF [Hyphobacterium]|uniref:Cell division coordinator CpoB n=1 Tax=Hyphobacterium vulgare TaxID=1736751 RepID=A0ABV6ZYW6_9PROT
MTRYFLLLPLILLLAAPAEAQSRREMAQRLDAAEARLAEMESRFMAGDPVAEQLLVRVDGLEGEMRDLRGTIEELEFQNRRMRQELERLGRDVDALMSAPANDNAGFGDEAMAGAGSPSSGPSGRAGGPADLTGNYAVTNPDDPYADERAAATRPLGGPSTLAASGAANMPARDPNTLYAEAESRLLDGDFFGAQEGFERFVADYPDHQRASEAQFWLGETYFINSDFAEAADAYIASLRADGRGPKAPDALVRLASSLSNLGRDNDACQTLGRFSSQFPNATADARARANREAMRIGCR